MNLKQLQFLFENHLEEGANLEIERSKALDKNQIVEITKDVSAMANANSGIIINGMIDEDHLLVGLDAYNYALFTKE